MAKGVYSPGVNCPKTQPVIRPLTKSAEVSAVLAKASVPATTMHRNAVWGAEKALPTGVPVITRRTKIASPITAATNGTTNPNDAIPVNKASLIGSSVNSRATGSAANKTSHGVHVIAIPAAHRCHHLSLEIKREAAI